MDPVQAIKALCQGWRDLDVDAVASLFCGDGLYIDPLAPRELQGPDDIRDVLGPSIGGLTSCKIDLGPLIADGDVGFVEGTFVSEGRDGPLEFPFAMLVEMRDGKIARLAEYFDTRPLVG
jgi:ketosteroid isomerase-like protein